MRIGGLQRMWWESHSGLHIVGVGYCHIFQTRRSGVLRGETQGAFVHIHRGHLGVRGAARCHAGDRTPAAAQVENSTIDVRDRRRFHQEELCARVEAAVREHAPVCGQLQLHIADIYIH